MKTLKICYLILAMTFAGPMANAENYAGFVNPFIGTDGHGHTFPAATYPFGMVQAGPDTRILGWDGCSGYHYSDSTILGFTHTHLSGTGCMDCGDILFMPVVDEEVKSPFSHKNETAKPGYYQVFLDHQKVNVRIAAGKRCAMHEYTYTAPGAKNIVIDLYHRDRLLGSSIEVVNNTTVRGWRQSTSWAKIHDVYFYAEFSEPFTGVDKVDSARLALAFDPSSRSSIKVKLALSSVSCENAKENLLSEIPDGNWNFNRLLDKTVKAWNQWLGRIRVDCPAKDKNTFYTALYHSAIHPSLYSDVNGEYRGMDRKVHKADGFERYTYFSTWDVFRAAFPLYNMIASDKMHDFLESMLAICREGGKLPRWELAGNETECMIGFNAVSMVADAFVKGIIPDNRKEDYYKAMTTTADFPDTGYELLKKYHYIPYEEDNACVSKTLELSYDSWCIATVAKALGHTDDYKEYIRRAQYWKNVFDTRSGFMKPRNEYEWAPGFVPTDISCHFTEANSWQYSFFTPQDIAGHIKLIGGAARYNAKLDSLFTAQAPDGEETLQDVTGLIGQYAHGNEPSHHVAYLYDFSGQPWKTQKLTRRICRELYWDRPDGLCGNEDCGQMSAWYVLSAIGLYSVTPGTSIMALTTPVVKKAVIDVNGQRFTIKNSDPGNDYIASATLNGKKWDSAAIDFRDMAAGGSLQLKTSAGPTQWGSTPAMVTEIPAEDIYNAEFPADFGRRKIAEKVLKMHAHARTSYTEAYTAGGDNGLVDGKRGKTNWRIGRWQGYHGNDVDVVLDLLGEKKVHCVSAGFLQDMGEYIWAPRDMEVYVSMDGENFELVGSRKSDVAIDDPKIQILDWDVSFPETTARYVRVIAHIFGEIPAWHRGYGDRGFTFIDEIWINNENN